MRSPTESANLIWIRPRFVDWSVQWSGSTTRFSEGWHRPYDHLSHADTRLAQASERLDRIDIIAALKRSIDSRLRKLDELYSLRKIPIRGLPRDPLDVLEALGVIRPLLLRNIRLLRNRVEHEDSEPPSIEDSAYYAEFVWFFLKATDRFVQSVPTSFHFAPDPTDPIPQFDVELRYMPTDSWVPEIAGWFRGSDLSRTEIDGWATIIVRRYASPPEVVARVRKAQIEEAGEADPMFSFAIAKHENREHSDVFLEGELRGPQSLLRSVFRRCMSPQ